MNEEDDIKIDQFLAGELEAKEARVFTKRLEQDKLLRQRVNLRRDLTDYLSSGEAELVDLLEDVGATSVPSKPLLSRWWWMLLSIIPAGLLFWQLNEKEDVPLVIIPIQSKTILKQDTVAKHSEVELQADTVRPAPAPAAPPPKSLPKQKQQPEALPVIPKKPSEVKIDTQVYASLDPVNFVPNVYLEDIVTMGLRSAENAYDLLLSSDQDTLRMLEAPSLLVTTEIEHPPAVELFIYDNQPESFLEERPLRQKKLGAWEENSVKKFIRISLKEIAVPGRYYLLLVNDEGDFLAGKRLLLR